MPGPKKGSTNRAGIMRLVREIHANERFYQVEVDETESPADTVFRELQRAKMAVGFIERQMQENWDYSLVSLREVSENGHQLVVTDTEEKMWLDQLGQERDRLLKVAKIAHDMGIDERRTELAERQSDIMFAVINQMIETLGLTAEQKEMVPKMLPMIIRSVAVPSVDTP